MSRTLSLVMSAAALASFATAARAEKPNPRSADVKLVSVTDLAKFDRVAVNADLDELPAVILERAADLFGRVHEALMGIATRIREAKARMRASNDLKQIGLAAHTYAGKYEGKIFPYAILDKKGKPLLSWRVALLPYLDQDNLYKQFKLDEPWDSKQNKALLEKMPKVYAPKWGKTKEPYSTYYRVFTGKDALFATNGKNPFTIATIPDGTSNTLLVVEAGEAVPWTKPDELEYDAKKPLPKLGGQFSNGFLAALADGSVRMVSKSVTEQTLRNAITPNDGNPLGSDW